MRPLRYAKLRHASLRAAASGPAYAGRDRLSDLAAFGSNPGELRALTYIPEALPADAPLVVVLHGCTQTAARYDHGSGWSQLADRHGFALLYPEQQRSNNPNLCFNWFVPGDCRRDTGEPFSIRQMIETVATRHGSDRKRIFITGLSAGGAMTSVMLATYPDVFAGGAIIAGLPYGCATSIPEAFASMRGGREILDMKLQARLRDASDHARPWPTVSVWHGSADQTVNPANAEAILSQWRWAHGLEEMPTRTESVDGYPRRVWCDSVGRECIESYTITGMGHGTPLATKGTDGCGASDAYMLDVNISSTRHIARFWGLATLSGVHADAKQSADASETPSWKHSFAGVQGVITKALRAAGLM